MITTIARVKSGPLVLYASPLLVHAGLLFPKLHLRNGAGAHTATVLSADRHQLSLLFGRTVYDFPWEAVRVEIRVKIDVGRQSVQRDQRLTGDLP